MASGYRKNGTDLDALLEPYVDNSMTTSQGSLQNYKMNTNTSLVNRYQKANGDAWSQTIFTGLRVNNGGAIGIAKGWFPTQTKFAEITSSGTFSLYWSNSGITIGNTTYSASSFRNGEVPKLIGFMMCGAGGGSGGWGCDAGDKSGYNVTPGGAGGGGGVIAGVITRTPKWDYNYSLTGTYQNDPSNEYITITLGSGGSAGGNGSGDSRPSTGSTGNMGGASSIQGYIWSDNSITKRTVYDAAGGKGGTGGRGDTAKGTGGDGGGTGVFTPVNGSVQLDNGVKTRLTGGTGGVPGTSEGAACSLTNFSFTTGSSPNTSTMFSNSTTGTNYNSGDSYRNSWAGGGCSVGTGANDSTVATYGGGGAAGKNNRNGASGYIAFYY